MTPPEESRGALLDAITEYAETHPVGNFFGYWQVYVPINPAISTVLDDGQLFLANGARVVYALESDGATLRWRRPDRVSLIGHRMGSRKRWLKTRSATNNARLRKLEQLIDELAPPPHTIENAVPQRNTNQREADNG